jgi:integral membrane protein (TIGR01906 family)
MRRRAILLAVAVAATPVLLGTALLVLIHPWTAKAAYALPGFPEPRIDLGEAERSRLAKVSIHAVQPWRPDGIETMRNTRRDDGRRAFNAEEMAHFEDVRRVVTLFLAAWAAGLLVIGAAAAVTRDRSAVRRALGAGAGLTLALVAATTLLMLVSFPTFFAGFHAIFFEGDTWRLPDEGTARSLYPDAFWALAGGAIVALVLLQAVALIAALRRRARHRQPETPPRAVAH